MIDKKNLPSKKFVIQASIIAVIFIISATTISLIKNSGSKIQISGALSTSSIQNDLLDKDVNKNKIPDWEEALWGTDDVEVINAKKKELSISGDSNEVDTINDTDKFSRELIANIAALKESGNLNQNSLNTLAQSVADSMETNRVLEDIYNESKFSKVTASSQNISSYMSVFQNTIQKYKSKQAGQELSIMGVAFEGEDDDQFLLLPQISAEYKKMADEFSKMKVPSMVFDEHILLTNDYAKIAIALKNMSQMAENPIVGLIGLSQYRTYAENAVENLAIIDKYAKDNGIVIVWD